LPQPAPSAKPAASLIRDAGFLPNFCGGEVIFNVIVLAAALAIVATIITPPLTSNIFKDLFLVTLFIEWIALINVAALCAARRYLNRLPERRALLMAYLLLLCATWAVSEAALWLLAGAGFIDSSRPVWYGYFHGQNLTVSAIVGGLALRYFIARHEARQKTLSEARARAEIQRQRIRPHFLFNSMNIIASLTQRAPARAESAIEDMADLFRLMLDENKELMPVHHEVQVARKYLKLERLRLDNRLNAEWHSENVPRTAKTPVLMLQLLLENAIRQGVEVRPEGGRIGIELGVEDGVLTVEVSAPEPPGDADADDPERDTALESIRMRLSDYYGEAGKLYIERNAGRFVFRVQHPAFAES